MEPIDGGTIATRPHYPLERVNFTLTIAPSTYDTFEEYSKAIEPLATYPESGTGSLNAIVYCALGAAGEGGEIADKAKKVLRDHGGIVSPATRDKILAEVGDELWYLDRLCKELGSSLGAAAYGNVEKLRDREARGVIGGDGDDR